MFQNIRYFHSKLIFENNFPIQVFDCNIYNNMKIAYFIIVSEISFVYQFVINQCPSSLVGLIFNFYRILYTLLFNSTVHILHLFLHTFTDSCSYKLNLTRSLIIYDSAIIENED